MVQNTKQTILQFFLQKTAWPMTPPAPWSAFHILFSISGLAIAGLVALFLGGSCQKAGPGKSRTIPRPCLILWICGIILAASEIYKQLFILQVVNHGKYDWWYFPFQLCSTPMYLCLIFPLFPSGTLQKTIATYLKAFGFLGGIMALAEPSGLMHPYWTLTLHGLMWHILLVFIAFFCTASGLAGTSTCDFLHTIPLFFIFCFIATFINIFTGGKADMFYISPYYPITQVVFHQISLVLGILPGIVIYLLSICGGAFLCCRLLDHTPLNPDNSGISVKPVKQRETP